MNISSLGNRIMVIGSPGSGKSTFSRRLAMITGIPLIHLDKEFWNSGWVETPKDEWARKQQDLISGEAWIMDGNYGRTIDYRLEKAETVIYIDLNRLICIMGYLKRVATNIGKTRPDMSDGCIEKLDWEFIRYIWNFPKASGRRNKERLAGVEDKNIIVFTKRKEVKQWLREIE